MKIKLPPKKEKEEKGPKRAFEEFSIDPSILEELDAIPDEEETSETIDVTAEELLVDDEQPHEEIEVVEETKKKEIVDASSSEFINIVRDNINLCAKEIKEISDTMQEIESQKNSESFWRKSENIRTISRNVNKMSEVQQKTLDLLVMFLGASGKMAEDYDTILETIDELGEVNGGEVEVLDYLLKIKKMVKEIKNNDERLKAIIYDNEQLKNKVSVLEKNYSEKVANFEKNSKITMSKLHHIRAKANQLSFFTLFAYVLIIAIGVILYIKVFR